MSGGMYSSSTSSLVAISFISSSTSANFISSLVPVLERVQQFLFLAQLFPAKSDGLYRLLPVDSPPLLFQRVVPQLLPELEVSLLCFDVSGLQGRKLFQRFQHQFVNVRVRAPFRILKPCQCRLQFTSQLVVVFQPAVLLVHGLAKALHRASGQHLSRPVSGREQSFEEV
ncbi:hypothetical protein MRX96_028820 [Rhipicephalus microplus]